MGTHETITESPQTLLAALGQMGWQGEAAPHLGTKVGLTEMKQGFPANPRPEAVGGSPSHSSKFQRAGATPGRALPLSPPALGVTHMLCRQSADPPPGGQTHVSHPLHLTWSLGPCSFHLHHIRYFALGPLVKQPQAPCSPSGPGAGGSRGSKPTAEGPAPVSSGPHGGPPGR